MTITVIIILINLLIHDVHGQGYDGAGKNQSGVSTKKNHKNIIHILHRP